MLAVVRWQGHDVTVGCGGSRVRRGQMQSVYNYNSESGLSIGALIGILVCTFVVVILLILGVIFFRPRLGRSRFRNPFRQHSVSYENALYNVDSASMEFQQEEQTSS
ncbi:hypothetical protein TNCV_272741 [Trichonephila clavipes]|nr:hypothetical protein TNCV_272741 [Trichonephila clavipes]